MLSHNGEGRDPQDREAALALALLDRNAAIRQMVNGVVAGLDVPIGFAAVVVDDLDTMQIVATNGTWGLTDLIIPSGRGLGGRVAAMRTPIVLDDYATSTEITHDFDLEIAKDGIRALAAAPITHGHQFLGVLFAATREPGTLDSTQFHGLCRLARQAGLALAVADHARDMADVAVHEERRRVALALHDSLGASLFTIGAAIRSLRADVEVGSELSARLGYIEEQTAYASATVRRTLLALNSAPEERALGVALQADARAFTERTGIEASAVVLGALPALAPTQSRELLLAVREALLNVEKHSRARSVIVSAYPNDGGVTVAVTDDGVGLASEVNARGDGLGLMAARERLARLGGSLVVTDGDDGGCAVKGWIPA
ncbi:MAG TPA: ATP-binding protein [Sporichthyaceae bacterium]|nr:ATP-binding protein [Sporichthyaceae bacterium]